MESESKEGVCVLPALVDVKCPAEFDFTVPLSEHSDAEPQWVHVEDSISQISSYGLWHGTGSRTVIRNIAELSGFGYLQCFSLASPKSSFEVLGVFELGTLNGAAIVRCLIQDEENGRHSKYLFKGTVHKSSIVNGTIWFAKRCVDNAENEEMAKSGSKQASVCRMDVEYSWVKKVRKKGYPFHYPSDRFADCKASVLTPTGVVLSGHFKVCKALQIWGKIAWAALCGQLTQWQLVTGTLRGIRSLEPTHPIFQRIALIIPANGKGNAHSHATDIDSLVSKTSASSLAVPKSLENMGLWLQCTNTASFMDSVANPYVFNGTMAVFSQAFVDAIRRNCVLPEAVCVGSVLFGNFVFDAGDCNCLLPLPFGHCRVFQPTGQCVFDGAFTHETIIKPKDEKVDAFSTPPARVSKSTAKKSTARRSKRLKSGSRKLTAKKASAKTKRPKRKSKRKTSARRRKRRDEKD